MFRKFAISVLLCSTCFLVGQELQIADFRLDETEQTANRAGSEKFDIDDNPCALLRLQTSEKGFVFDTGTIGFCEVDENQIGEIWVWLRPNTRFLSIRHPKLGSVNRYAIPVRIEGKRTYYARLISGKRYEYVEEALTEQYVKFFVEPKDALLTFNNEPLPLTDGYGYRRMRFGTYSYTVELADYHSLTGVVTLNDADKAYEEHIRLRPAFGWIEVSGKSAEGATIYIDNRPIGVAPIKSQNLSSGQHRIKLVKSKYATFEQTVTVEDEKTVQLNPTLQAQFARVLFRADDPQTEIYINNQRRGEGSVSDEFGYGSYLIECRKPSHRTTSRNIEITAAHHNQTITLEAPVPIYGRLSVETNAPNATIFVDGEDMGKAPKLLSSVLIGKRTIVLRQQGYADGSSTVTVEEGKTANVSISLQNSFSVTLSCSNRNAQIYLRKKGETSYQNIGTGSYSGRLALGDYEVKTSAADCNDALTSFAVVSNTDNNITLSAPVPKVEEKKQVSVNGISFNMIRVEGDTFTMGCTSERGSDCYNDEKPSHQVTLSSYYIGETEVTQELWQAVMGRNPSYFSGSKNPVEKVSWDDCKDFIHKLNQLTGMTFRLPTEAEWEYAARGGKKSRGYKYAGSNNLKDVAWYGQWNGNIYDNGNSGEKTHAVATKQPNELGIYDMSGNVDEWCEDWYGSYQSYSQTNPQGASSGSSRVLRGGSWTSGSRNCRVSSRNDGTPGSRRRYYGFRLVLVP